MASAPIHVSPHRPGGPTTISEALGQASPGAEIVVHPGQYHEQVHVTFPVTIRAHGDPGSVRVVNLQRGPVLVHQGGDVRVRGLILVNEDKTNSAVWTTAGRLRLEDCEVPSPSVGVDAEPGTRPILTRCTFTRPGACGIFLKEADAAIEDCVVIDALVGQDKHANGMEIHGGVVFVAGFTVRGAGGHALRVADGAVGRFDDVEITAASRGGSGMAAVHVGTGARPEFRRLRIHHSRGHGLWIQGAGGTYEDCEVTGLDGDVAAMGVSDGADPVVRRFRADGIRNNGIWVGPMTRGTYEDCAISGATLVGFYAAEGSAPTVRRVTVRDGVGYGFQMVDSAGEYVDCAVTDMRDSQVAVNVVNGAAPTVRGLTLRALPGTGIGFENGGAGVFEDVEITDVGGHGLHVTGMSAPTVRKTRVSGRAETAVTVSGAGGRYEDLTITARESTVAVSVVDNADPRFVRAAVEARSVGFGVDGAQGTYTDCEVTGTNRFGVLVQGGANPRFERLLVHDASDIGLSVTDGATGTYLDCAVRNCTRTADSGAVHIHDAAAPTVRGLTISGHEGRGLSLRNGARGSFSGVEIDEVGGAGLSVGPECEPRLEDITVRAAGDEKLGAVTVIGAHISLRGLTVERGRSEALYVQGGFVSVESLRVEGAEESSNAVVVAEDGNLQITSGRVAGPGACGLASAGGTLRVRGLEVTGWRTGVAVLGDGTAELDDCAVTGNTSVGVSIDSTRRVSMRGCAVEGNGTDIELSPTAPDPLLTRHTGPLPARLARPHADAAASPPPVVGRDDGTWAKTRHDEAADRPDLAEALAMLEGLVGLDRVKDEVRKLVNVARLRERRGELGLPVPPFNRHLVFTGPPGTGKTEVARIYARVAASLGLIRRAHVEKVDRGVLIGGHIGATEENTEAAIERARGGVLFIDEAYQLVSSDDSDRDFGRKAVEVLLSRMEELRDELVVIVAGYEREMDRFLSSNPGLRSRFTTTIAFPNYTPAELVKIVAGFADRHGFVLADDTRTALAAHFGHVCGDPSFGNARHARTVFDAMTIELAARTAALADADRAALSTLLPEDVSAALRRTGLGAGAGVEDPDRVAELLAELDAMIGLADVKREIREVVAELRMARRLERANKPVPATSRHLVFVGPPGTGKTQVARLYGRLLAALGMLPEGQFVEATKTDLVAEYVGQTGPKTAAKFREARGGVLFIDEAYALTPRDTPGHDFNGEAVAQLLTLMERHRHDTVVIAAGYPEEMDRFLSANPGLRSRFARRIGFPAYDTDELVQIFLLRAREAHQHCPSDTVEAVRTRLAATPRGADFGNARHVDDLLRAAMRRKAVRLMDDPNPDDTELTTLRPEDITDAVL